MAAPKGHIPYAGCEKGGDLGGRPEKYTQQKIEQEADAFLEWVTRWLRGAVELRERSELEELLYGDLPATETANSSAQDMHNTNCNK